MRKLLLIGLVAASFLAGCSGKCSMKPAGADDTGYSCNKAKCASCSAGKPAKSCEQGKGCSSCQHHKEEGSSCSRR